MRRNKMSLLGYTIQELEEKLHKKEMSATELTEMAFARIAEVEDKVNAFITLNEDEAKEKAKKLDEKGNRSGKLFAMPMGIKDNIMTKGLRTTCASQFLKDFNDPLYDATAVEQLYAENAITIGKLNMDEFAMGSTTENSSYQKTKNPWNLKHVPGGSSGGSAAAVAAGEVLFSLGSDTGGSIRQPASFSGIVGMKPTYGRVSRYGLVAFAPSLDQMGPLTQTVADNARVLEVICGHDVKDSTSANRQQELFTESLNEEIKGLRIAVPEEFLAETVDAEVREAISNALKMYELLGANIEKVSLPHTAYAAAAYYAISSAEASTSLARFDGVRFGVRAENTENVIDMMKQSRGQGFGDEVKKRILFGTYALSADNYVQYFEKAQKVRTLIKEEFATLFETYDVVMGPTSATTAYQIDEDIDPNIGQMNDQLTVPVNLAGLPAISLPCGFSETELPIGLQIIGNHFEESKLYRVAHAYEQATNHHKKRPVLEGEDE